jgi:transaldolase
VNPLRRLVELGQSVWYDYIRRGLYVEALVAPDSVNTMPPETFEASRDHGDPKVRIHDDLHAAHAVFQGLEELKIDEQRISREREAEGAEKFFDSYERVLKAVERKEELIHAAR